MLAFFPMGRHERVRVLLALTLKAIVSQRLVTRNDGTRVVAVEILLDTPKVKDLISRGELRRLKEAMERGTKEGMQTFDQSMLQLYNEGKISFLAAMGNSKKLQPSPYI